jgi:uncharacterized phage-associated protein
MIFNMGYKFNTQDYILYILNHLEPDKSDLWRLNKIAFLVEFAYLYFNESPLSKANYAAIDYGPVIDHYKDILKEMEKGGLIKVDGYKIRVISSDRVGNISDETKKFVDPLIKKYSEMTKGELKALSHSTDSYKITTENEKVMGRTIDKSLANLESFFDENNDIELSEDSLPVVNKSDLVEYGN